MNAKRILTAALLFTAHFCAFAGQPWKVTLLNHELNLRMVIDLYEETVNVPSMDMFGPMNGYIGGCLCNVWSLTSFKIENETKASLRLSNDLGSETQEATLTILNDSTYHMELTNGAKLRKVVNHKYVKMPVSFDLTPRK